MSEPVSISSLLVPSKTVEFEFPGIPEFKVELCYLGRGELQKLVERCQTTKYNKVTKQKETEIDEKKFVPEYCKAIVKGWSGLKLKHLEEFLLVEFPPERLNDEVGFDLENVQTMYENSSEFQEWVTTQSGDLANFTKSK